MRRKAAICLNELGPCHAVKNLAVQGRAWSELNRHLVRQCSLSKIGRVTQRTSSGRASHPVSRKPRIAFRSFDRVTAERLSQRRTSLQNLPCRGHWLNDFCGTLLRGLQLTSAPSWLEPRRSAWNGAIPKAKIGGYNRTTRRQGHPAKLQSHPTLRQSSPTKGQS